MPEVAGDACILVDPFNISEIAEALQTIISRPGLSESMIEKGFARTQIFTWEKTAGLFYDCIIKAINPQASGSNNV